MKADMRDDFGAMVLAPRRRHEPFRASALATKLTIRNTPVSTRKMTIFSTKIECRATAVVAFDIIV